MGGLVEKRVITSYSDAGRQMPSGVNHLVKVGANALHVIGEFSAVASSTTIGRSTHLEDYTAPTNTEANPAASEAAAADDEVMEGASRVSLRCPISHQRLVTPVIIKATTCRHLQCFEYDSFLEINETRPSWRCPCCNRFTSWPDLRIDRKVERILKATDESIHEVIISQDGSWEPGATDENQTSDEAVVDLSKVADGDELPEKKPDKQTLLDKLQDSTGKLPEATRNGVDFAAASAASQGNNSRAGFHLNSLGGG